MTSRKSIESADHDCIIKSAGVDWLTVTSVEQPSKAKLHAFFSEIVASDLKEGYQVTTGGAYGFYGHRCRHALFAEKQERAMLQVSGSRAQRSVMLADARDNCTRIDIQVTLYVGEDNVEEWLRMQETSLRNRQRGEGHAADQTTVAKNGRIQTVYSGSRKSDIFFRCYDKYSESGKEEYKGCVRMEVELKGKTSKALWRHIATEGLGTMYLLQTLLYLAEKRGLQVSCVDLDRQDIILPSKPRTKTEVTIGWFATQVAPSVARISAERGWIAAFAPLFHAALHEHDIHVIMSLLSRTWGN